MWHFPHLWHCTPRVPRWGTAAAECWEAILFSCSLGPQQQTCSSRVRRANGTDRWADRQTDTLYNYTDPAPHTIRAVAIIRSSQQYSTSVECLRRDLRDLWWSALHNSVVCFNARTASCFCSSSKVSSACFRQPTFTHAWYIAAFETVSDIWNISMVLSYKYAAFNKTAVNSPICGSILNTCLFYLDVSNGHQTSEWQAMCNRHLDNTGRTFTQHALDIYSVV